MNNFINKDNKMIEIQTTVNTVGSMQAKDLIDFDFYSQIKVFRVFVIVLDTITYPEISFVVRL